ncbi:MAG: hypothetical protein GX221_05280 [Candidatus Riflebacteria bacterium]|nr:hypothetical protein [Candidatus Riflebacteria bacterium]
MKKNIFTALMLIKTAAICLIAFSAILTLLLFFGILTLQDVRQSEAESALLKQTEFCALAIQNNLKNYETALAFAASLPQLKQLPENLMAVRLIKAAQDFSDANLTSFNYFLQDLERYNYNKEERLLQIIDFPKAFLRTLIFRTDSPFLINLASFFISDSHITDLFEKRKKPVSSKEISLFLSGVSNMFFESFSSDIWGRDSLKAEFIDREQNLSQNSVRPAAETFSTPLLEKIALLEEAEKVLSSLLNRYNMKSLFLLTLSGQKISALGSFSDNSRFRKEALAAIKKGSSLFIGDISQDNDSEAYFVSVFLPVRDLSRNLSYCLEARLPLLNDNLMQFCSNSGASLKLYSSQSNSSSSSVGKSGDSFSSSLPLFSKRGNHSDSMWLQFEKKCEVKPLNKRPFIYFIILELVLLFALSFSIHKDMRKMETGGNEKN